MGDAHARDLLRQVRQAIGLFVTTNASTAVLSTVDRIEFTACVIVWLYLVWKLEGKVTSQLKELQNAQRAKPEGIRNTYLNLLLTLLLQLESVLMFLVVQDIHDLAISSTSGETSTQTSTMVCIIVFVGVDGVVKEMRERDSAKHYKFSQEKAKLKKTNGLPSEIQKTGADHKRQNFKAFTILMALACLTFLVLESTESALFCAAVYGVILFWSFGQV